MRRSARAAVGTLALVLCACGIPTSQQADVVPPRNVPFQLLSPVVPSTTTTTIAPAPTVAQPIYLVKSSDAVTAVVRQVVSPATLVQVLDALLVGPTVAQTAAGLSTALPQSVRVVSATTIGPTATIAMNPAFTAISGPSQVLAVAQLVMTATRQPGVTSVLFTVDGAIVPVPTASGATTASPVTAASYAALLSP